MRFWDRICVCRHDIRVSFLVLKRDMAVTKPGVLARSTVGNLRDGGNKARGERPAIIDGGNTW